MPDWVRPREVGLLFKAFLRTDVKQHAKTIHLAEGQFLGNTRGSRLVTLSPHRLYCLLLFKAVRGNEQWETCPAL